jgi:hypothetical protein
MSLRTICMTLPGEAESNPTGPPPGESDRPTPLQPPVPALNDWPLRLAVFRQLRASLVLLGLESLIPARALVPPGARVVLLGSLGCIVRVAHFPYLVAL